MADIIMFPNKYKISASNINSNDVELKPFLVLAYILRGLKMSELSKSIALSHNFSNRVIY